MVCLIKALLEGVESRGIIILRRRRPVSAKDAGADGGGSGIARGVGRKRERKREQRSLGFGLVAECLNGLNELRFPVFFPIYIEL
ncbi:hypothetical protein Q3G72_035308 [Acer saccharum]|nr:hypothetical protein Q3G72_035308 [Acer saccharum]